MTIESAGAKMPPFEVDVERLGSPGALLVRVEMDASLANGFPAQDLDGLLAAFPASLLSGDLRPRAERGDAVAIRLRRTVDGAYEGVLRLPPADAAWYIVPFPNATISGAELARGGYPAALRVDPDGQLGKRLPYASAVAVAGGAIVVAAFARRARTRAAMAPGSAAPPAA